MTAIVDFEKILKKVRKMQADYVDSGDAFMLAEQLEETILTSYFYCEKDSRDEPDED